ncbi:FliH/SctL family protein [Nocardioides sp. SYSU DS0663]|uniref:FliH/SctL family protein n=1 Tax=Nocardioides sp. SYSU DS0663 TaxID=3416445 RepID=UPI003F4BB4BA
MSSSSDAAVLRAADATAVRVPKTPELRTGAWTRFGASSILGDQVTEETLSGLAESARRAARSQGYAVGWAEGRREAAATAKEVAARREAEAEAAERRREAEHREAVAGLQRAAERVADTTAELEQLVHDQALRLARELTEALVGHELRSSPDPADDVVRRVLAQRADDRPVVARLHPGLLDREAVAELARSGVRVIEDADVGPTDALVEVEGQVVDLRVERRLARVREVLS